MECIFYSNTYMYINMRFSKFAANSFIPKCTIEPCVHIGACIRIFPHSAIIWYDHTYIYPSQDFNFRHFSNNSLYV